MTSLRIPAKFIFLKRKSKLERNSLCLKRLIQQLSMLGRLVSRRRCFCFLRVKACVCLREAGIWEELACLKGVSFQGIH